VKLGAAGGAALALPGWAHADEEFLESVEKAYYADTLGEGFRRMTVGLRYRTDPERYARLLPPGVEPDDPVVIINFVLNNRRPEGEWGVMYCGPTYNESDSFVAVKYQGNQALLELELQLEQDWGRTAGRSNEGLHKKDGKMRLEREGSRVRASTTRRGQLLFAIEGEVTDQTSHPLYWFREPGWGWLRYRLHLHPDWRQGPLRDRPVELYRLHGADLGYPSGPVEGPNLPKAFDLSRSTVWVNEDFPLNPLCELPVVEVLGASFHEGEDPRQRRTQPRGPEGTSPGPFTPGPVLLETITVEEFEPWSLQYGAYDRPVTAGTAWVPDGWPDRATAMKLSRAEIERYRAREAYALDPIDYVDIQLEVDRELHASSVPPVCEPGDDPLIRILALDVEQNDFSPDGFVELWLLTRCEVGGEAAWFAHAHIIGWGGDVFFGRETFGYPTKLGHPEMRSDQVQVNIRGRRLYRDFFHGVVPLSYDPPAPHEDAFEVLGMQVLGPSGSARADLVGQPWMVHLEHARHADPRFVKVMFPKEPGPGRIGLSDPWFEFSSGRVVSAVAGRGAMKRLPGRIHHDWPDYVDYFVQRIDGGSSTTSNATFLNPKASDYWRERYPDRS
jgi:acetoacetate decarboxylase